MSNIQFPIYPRRELEPTRRKESLYKIGGKLKRGAHNWLETMRNNT